ncbi:glucans biosynthesis glucosyltransferase MdoH [Rhodovulum sp. 12E13]|nr:glucans biosynthesis glucosyltransferase MdoH [Rhodovulum sp. 12E13]
MPGSLGLRTPRVPAHARALPTLRAAGPAWLLVMLVALFAGVALAALVAAVVAWTPAAIVAVALAVPTTLWIAGGAATSVVGLIAPPPPSRPLPPGWRPNGRLAVLTTLCGEPPEPVAERLAALHADLAASPLAGAATLYALSDTRGADRVAAEERALAPLVASGRVIYRRRADNAGRKPGNIADWLARAGAEHDHMLVLDADSWMRADRIARLVHRMEREPRLGLIQAGMRLVPAATRFGRAQRTAARLLGGPFVRGFAASTGETGNYWGHNALIRVAAFREAGALKGLPGRAPFGGDVLSHDFIEAAQLARAGWAVEVDPDTAGSAEGGPQTLADFHRRDRRWCQGNLQHLRLIGSPGYAPLSRLHLASGIFSYLAAPCWLVLFLLAGSGAVALSGWAPAVAVVTLLAVPKLCGLATWLPRARTAARRRTVLRAAASEAVTSTLVAPMVMMRQTGAVLSVLAGRDCGWRTGVPAVRLMPPGGAEALAGAAAGAALLAANPGAAPWFVPVLAPLLAAPVLVPWLERAP